MSVDPDQMLRNAASDQGLHCLPLIQQFLHMSTCIKWTVQILGQVWYGVSIFRVNTIKSPYPVIMIISSMMRQFAIDV